MKDWGYEPEVWWSLPLTFLVGKAAPVFHVYRVQMQGLNFFLALLYSAVRTPFTCLLDAAEPDWVLRYTVA